MKKTTELTKWMLVLAFSFCILFSSLAQDKSKRPSPPDQVSQTVEDDLIVTISYSQPAVKGRTIWGGLVPYGEVWRTGANEATWIEVSKDVMIGEARLPKGKYSLFTIPREGEWTIIFNKSWKQWGAYEYDSSKDVLRTTALPRQSDDFTERLTFTITPNGLVSLDWENVTVSFELDVANIN